MTDILAIVLSSAAIGAVVSSRVNGIFNVVIKNRELKLQDLTFATRLAELKHQQLMAVQEWAAKEEGKTRPIDLWDPFQTVIDYIRGLEEFRKTGQWERAETSHKQK